MKEYFWVVVVVFLYVLGNQCLNSTKIYKKKNLKGRHMFHIIGGI